MHAWLMVYPERSRCRSKSSTLDIMQRSSLACGGMFPTARSQYAAQLALVSPAQQLGKVPERLFSATFTVASCNNT